MNQSEANMIRRMCLIKLNERKRSEELRGLGIGNSQCDDQQEII